MGTIRIYRTLSNNHYHSYLLKANIFITIFLFLFCGSLTSQTLSAENIYKKISDAVVVILAYDSNNELSTQGSGVVINDKGYVVTNYHVLAGNDRLEVLHNKEIVPYVDIIGIDVEKDILIIKIDDNKFPFIKIGDSKNLTIGQRIYAVGSPLGFENTISEGIISGLRSYKESRKDFIQITASISPGSSGGAIVNDKGELIGISILTIKEGQNLNFAIPINDVLNVEISSYSKNNDYKNFELFYKGNDEFEKGNYQEAIKYYTNYIKEYPSDAVAYYNRGISKDNLEDYRGAIQDYTKAIEINPNYADPYINRGVAKGRLEDYRGAIQDFNKALEVNPNIAEAYNNRGIAKDHLKDYRGAIQDYNEALEINPNDAGLYFNRGLTKGSLGDYRGAIKDFTKAIEINPNYAGAYSDRGFAKYNLEDYWGAIQDLNKAVEINPNDEFSYNENGLAKFHLEDYRGAIQDFTKAIEINPNYIEAYSNRGLAKNNLGDKTGACLDWSKAGELGGDFAYDFIRELCN